MRLLSAHRKSEQTGPGDRFRGVAWDKLPLPTAPLIAPTLWGPSEGPYFRRCTPDGEERLGSAPGRESPGSV